MSWITIVVLILCPTVVYPVAVVVVAETDVVVLVVVCVGKMLVVT